MRDCDFEEMGLGSYISFLRKEACEKKMPFKGVLELTPRCNFSCNMCYVHLKPEEIPAIGRELTTEEWLETGRQLQRAGVLELTLTGGEPFARPDFRQIYEAFHDMGFMIQIFSNGSLIREDTMEWLSRRPPAAMRFTLYGACNETYEKVCGVRDGFARVERSVELVQAAGIPLYLAATVTRENERDLGKIYQFAAKRRLPAVHTASLLNPVRGASADPKSHQVERQLPPPEALRRLREQSKGRFPRKPCTDFLSVCRNYRSGFWITWNGMLQLCAFLTEPAVPVTPGEDRFMECWECLLAELEKLRQPAECASCRYEQYCERCPGVLYAENGSCSRISESFCAEAEFNYLLYGSPIEE